MTLPAPAFLPPTWRYAGDDWVLVFRAFTVQPTTFDGSGNPTNGTSLNLTGYTATGSFQYRPTRRRPGHPNWGVPSDPLPTPVPTVVDAENGVISLSLDSTYTAFPRQDLSEWGRVGGSLLLVRPGVIDPSSKVTTIGIQELFVF